MNLHKCKECGEEFKSDKALHGHLRKHKITTEEYYLKHFPRFDLHTHAPIKFKTVKQYLSSDFNSNANFRRWCASENPEAVKNYLVENMAAKNKEKGRVSVIGEAQMISYGWPSVSQIEKLFGSYKDFCDRLDLPPQFGFPMTKNFNKDYSDVEIWVDTREQKPLNFMNPTKDIKLDCGDYAVGGENFSDTFVDRKSAADFIATVTRGLDRFKKEMDRCCSLGAYMFIVVDASMAGVAKELQFSRSHVTIQHVWHNMREIMDEYNGDCQFVFSGGRAESALLVPKILMCGKDLWRTDVQYHINNNDKWLGK